jgi:hypothetical protein
VLRWPRPLRSSRMTSVRTEFGQCRSEPPIRSCAGRSHSRPSISFKHCKRPLAKVICFFQKGLVVQMGPAGRSHRSRLRSRRPRKRPSRHAACRRHDRCESRAFSGQCLGARSSRSNDQIKAECRANILAQLKAASIDRGTRTLH